MMSTWRLRPGLAAVARFRDDTRWHADRKELGVLLRVLNREVVEACIYMDAALHAPEVELSEGPAPPYELIALSICCLITAVLAVVFIVVGPPLLTGIASALAIESVVILLGMYYRQTNELFAHLAGAFGVMGLPATILGAAVVEIERSVRDFLLGFGVPVMACSLTWYVFYVIFSDCHGADVDPAVKARRKIAAEDPMAGMGPALLDTLDGSGGKEHGKYFGPEHRRTVLFASRCDARATVLQAERRVLTAAYYMMEKAMTIYPDLRWCKEEVMCAVSLPGGGSTELRLPFIRVSVGQDSFVARQCYSTLFTLRDQAHHFPFAAFVHHASQPDPETGETLVDDDMMRARRQAFLALHGLGGEGHSVSEALPPMTGAVEELKRQHEQAAGSAVVHPAQAQGRGTAVDPGERLWEGDGSFSGYGGISNNSDALESDADRAAKQKEADGVGNGHREV